MWPILTCCIDVFPDGFVLHIFHPVHPLMHVHAGIFSPLARECFVVVIVQYIMTTIQRYRTAVPLLSVTVRLQ